MECVFQWTSPKQFNNFILAINSYLYVKVRLIRNSDHNSNVLASECTTFSDVEALSILIHFVHWYLFADGDNWYAAVGGRSFQASVPASRKWFLLVNKFSLSSLWMMAMHFWMLISFRHGLDHEKSEIGNEKLFFKAWQPIFIVLINLWRWFSISSFHKCGVLETPWKYASFQYSR